MSPAALAPAWLTARPIAHRGLHDAAAGRFENSLSAARAAAAAGFSIECDVQRSADGEAVVFHDFDLPRMTGAGGPVADLTALALGALKLGTSGDRIVALSAFLAVVDSRVPIVCEVKSAFKGDMRLAARVAEVARDYPGPLAIKSFDPDIMAYLRTLPELVSRGVPLGIVAEASYDHPEWADLGEARKRSLAALTHVGETRPDFLSYHVGDLPHAAATLMRSLDRPVMTWTVRTPEQRERAAQWADQMVFEGFHP